MENLKPNNTLILKIQEDSFSNIPQEIRSTFEVLKVEPNDAELFEGDEHYSKLMKSYRKASKELIDYQYNVRHDFKG